LTAGFLDSEMLAKVGAGWQSPPLSMTLSKSLEPLTEKGLLDIVPFSIAHFPEPFLAGHFIPIRIK
jgi:hypothetical protein